MAERTPVGGFARRGFSSQTSTRLSSRQGRSTLLRLWKYLSDQRVLLILSLLMAVLGNGLALLGPMLSGNAINAIEPGPGAVDFPTVFRYAGWMVLCYAASALLFYFLNRIMIRMSQNIVYRLRRDTFNHLLELPVEYYDRTPAGDIVSRISYDIDTVGSSLSTDLVQIVVSGVSVLGSLVMMLMLAPRLVLIFCVTIPVSLAFTRYRAKKVRPLFRRRSAELGDLNGFSEERISGLKTIKAYHREDVVTRRFDARNTQAVDAYYEADRYSSITGPSVMFINNLSLSLISVIGALLYLEGGIDLGTLSSFVLYSRRFSGPINETANIISELQSAVSAAERIFHLLDEAPEAPDAPDAVELTEVRGNVDMDHVRFGYDPDRVILHDLSLHAKAGSLIAIVGPTGAGKTTLINLLMRFYDPQSGTISIDGREICQVTRKSLRLAYAMVLQDTWLFSGTIFENIAYGRENATMEEVVAAAKAAHIHEYITQLPQGYDTPLSEEGMNISKGQKQMLTIARAMLLDAKMLILDEATSNVDTRTEEQIQHAMRGLMEDKTCFVIAHRLSTIQKADLILVVRDGNVVEQGTHEELLARKGFYAEMYQSQFR